MLLLVAPDHLGELTELPAQSAFRTGFGIERRLDVLEEQRKIENPNVLGGRRRRRREFRQPCDDQTPGGERPSSNDRALKEAGSGMS